jgi:hypothetical protein
MPTELDVFAIYREGDIYLIPIADIVGRISITLTPESTYYAGSIEHALVAQLESALAS